MEKSHTLQKHSVYFLILLCVAFFVGYIPTHAQVPELSTGIQLVVSPEFPRPHTEVTLSLDDYHIDTTGATIQWYVNEVEQKSVRNERSISVTTGDIGSHTVVRVALTKNGSRSLTKSITLNPSIVDVILEADTYTPSLYAGRALPSTESLIRAIAVVHDNTRTPDSDYTYEWKLDTTVLKGGQTKGKNSIDLSIPLYGEHVLSVSAINAQGVAVGSGAILLESEKPEIHFYEESPLRGLSRREIQNTQPLIGDEITIYGEPYFINKSTHNTFAWKINNTPSEGNQDAPNSITLQKNSSNGKAYIELSVLNTLHIPQFIEKAFQIVF